MKKIIIAIFLLVSNISNAQKNDVVFTVADKQIKTAEFERVYKKNIDLVQDKEQKKIANYLDLYINYQLKLQEAYRLGLDKDKKYQRELKQYRKDLMKSYLTDANATQILIKEAYDRSLKEVKASHILIRVAEDALPKDTLLAYNKLAEIRKKAVSGEKFAVLAKQFSEDPSAKTNGGDLGYFSVFQMVYPFENAVYNTPKNQISPIFRTRFGYHIAKIDDVRPAHGEVQIAHIMIASNKKNAAAAKKKIDDIYTQLESGVDFATLAKRLSDDKKSAVKGGILPVFGINKMVPSFEKAAFSIEKEGDFTKPFQSPYGWHIAKLLKKIPVASFEKSKAILKRKIERDIRSKLITKAFLTNIKSKYNVNTYSAKIEKEFENELNETYFSGQWKPSDAISKNKLVALKINRTEFTLADFATFLQRHQIKVNGNRNPNLQNVLKKQYASFVDTKIMDYYKQHLEGTNPDFANTIQEYRDGVLLFDLMNKEVWEKASKDTLGLKAYYENNKTKYMWKPRATILLATVTTKAKAKAVCKLLKAGKTQQEIEKMINTDKKLFVLFSQKKTESDATFLPQKYKLKSGVSKVYKDGKNYVVLKASDLKAPKTKTFEESRGRVINDYQQELEKKWLEKLRKKYTIKINQKVVDALTKKYN